MCTVTCQGASSDYGIGEFSFPEAIGADDVGNLYVDTFGRVDKWGEPPTPLLPTPESPTQQEGSSLTIVNSGSPREAKPPSNAFRFGKRRWNRKRGTMKVRVLVGGAGRLVANAGPKVAALAPQPRAAGPLTVSLKATGKGRGVLRRSGRLWAALRVASTPTHGTPNTRTKAVRLLKKRKEHKR